MHTRICQPRYAEVDQQDAYIYTRATTKSASRPYAASTAERTSIHVCNVFALTFFDRLMGILQYFRILHNSIYLFFFCVLFTLTELCVI